MKARKMLDEGMMRMCEPPSRSITPDEELDLPRPKKFYS
jgi:hypothetical protein